MKFGLLIRGQHGPSEPIAACHRADLELARRAEALGFDSVGRAAHYSAAPYQMLSQIPFLAQVAALAPRLRLMTGVTLLPMQKPLDIAEQLATLDVMSDGKLIFGAGVGYRDVEFKAFGTTLKDAGPRFEENLVAVKRLWTEGRVTMRGSHFELEDASCSVKPIQKPMPPIWIGANKNVGIRRAARMADAWFINPHTTLAMLERQLDLYRRELDCCGKPFPPPELPMLREVFIGPTREAAARIARPALEAKYAAYRAWGQDAVMPGSEHFDRAFEELAADRFLLGTADEIAEQMLALSRRFCCNYFCFGVHLPRMSHNLAFEQLHMLAEEVLPAVQAAA